MKKAVKEYGGFILAIIMLLTYVGAFTSAMFMKIDMMVTISIIGLLIMLTLTVIFMTIECAISIKDFFKRK